jgi:type IV pilus assembly protein PilA
MYLEGEMEMKQLLKKRLKNQRGLTLVELLAVVVILGIISSIAVPSIGKIIEETRVKAVKADAIQVLNAAKLYVASGNSIPSTGVGIGTGDTDNELKDFVEDINTLSAFTVTYENDKFLITAASASGYPNVTITKATVSEINKSTSDTTEVRGAAAPAQTPTN